MNYQSLSIIVLETHFSQLSTYSNYVPRILPLTSWKCYEYEHSQQEELIMPSDTPKTFTVRFLNSQTRALKISKFRHSYMFYQNSSLECIFTYYRSVNFGNENCGEEDIWESENYLNVLHNEENERDGWIDFVINSYYGNLITLIHADCLIKGLKAEISVFHLTVFFLSTTHYDNAIIWFCKLSIKMKLIFHA